MIIDEDIAELIGIHIGDGCISKNQRYHEYYLGGDLKEEKEYHDLWVGPLFNKKIMVPFFGNKVCYKEHPKVGIYGFHIFDKRLVKFFEELGVASGPKLNIGIPEEIRNNKNLHKRFIRGLFDTDGNIYFDKNRSCKNPINNVPNIKLDNVSNQLVEQVMEMLIGLGLHPRLKKPYQGKRNRNKVHTLLIYRRGDVRYFIKNIGFKNAKHHTKWLVFEKLGSCPPRTTLDERRLILKGKKIYKLD